MGDFFKKTGRPAAVLLEVVWYPSCLPVEVAYTTYEGEFIRSSPPNFPRQNGTLSTAWQLTEAGAKKVVCAFLYLKGAAPVSDLPVSRARAA